MRQINIKHRVRLISILTLLSICGAIAQIGQITGVHDPVMIKCNDEYYIFHTGDEIGIRKSSDMHIWRQQGSVFTEIPEWGVQEVSGVRNIWAPDIFYYNEMYYLFYSLSTFGSNRSRIGVAINKTLDKENPDYLWEDLGKVFESNTGDNYNAIDANILQDASGRIWMSFGSFWSGIKITELNPETMKPVKSDLKYTIAARPGNTAIEAPFIIYRHGYYYLFVSFDACCQGVNSTYNIRVGRSKNVIGIYRDKSNYSMLSGGGTQILKSGERWIGPGHCAVFSENSVDWLVYHAYDAEKNGVPTLRIKRLDWDENNWPVVNDTIVASINMFSKDRNAFSLQQNYPNPFNPSTTIAYSLETPSEVSLKIFNTLGEEIKTLVNQRMPSGEHSIAWTPENLPGGIYFYSLHTSNYKKTMKSILLK